MKRFWSLLGAIWICAATAHTQSVYRVPEQYASIQAAITASPTNNGTILVAPGVYREAIQFKGKSVNVRSEAGPNDTVIIAPAGLFAVTFGNAESTNAILNGFTISNSTGGIYITGSSPTITSNLIINCDNGINCQSSRPIIRGNRITGASGVPGKGGQQGLSLGNAGGTIENNIIEANESGIYGSGNPVILNNTIRRNRGDGITLGNNPDADIIQNVIVENDYNGIVVHVSSGSRGPLIVHNTIINNGRVLGSGIATDGYHAGEVIINNIVLGNVGLVVVNTYSQPNPTVQFNNIFSPIGKAYDQAITNQTGINGNISSMPAFLDFSNADFKLIRNSPGIDRAVATTYSSVDFEGHARVVDGDGDGKALPDMGAFEYVPAPPRPLNTLTAASDPLSVKLAWIPFDGATNFLVNRATISSGPYIPLALVAGTNYTDVAVVPKQLYYYAIAGSNEFGLGPNSAAVSVTAGNHPPIASNDVAQVLQNNSVIIPVLDNDNDSDGDPLTLKVLVVSTNGTATITNNSVLFKPLTNFFGTTSLTYLIQDGRGGSATGLVTVIVQHVNQSPVISDRNYSFVGNTEYVVQLQAQDVDSTQFNFTITSPPLHGLASVNAAGFLTYRPAHAFNGSDSLKYIASDGQTNSAEATIRYTVLRPADLNQDGMADYWQVLWDIGNPLGDPDQDGMPSFREYIADTAPRDPFSVLRISRIYQDVRGRWVVEWASVGGVRYRVESADQLKGNGQTLFQGLVRLAEEEIDPAPYGVPSIQSMVDTRPPPTNGLRFYRIATTQ